MKKREIYICVTLYHLFVALLLINKRQSKENSMLLLNANDSNIYDLFCMYKVKLKDKDYNVDCRLRNKLKDILGIEGIKSRKQYALVKKKWCANLDNNFILFNFAWNMQYIYSTANLYFKKSFEVYFIEEGALTSINPPQSNLKILLKKMTGTVVDFYREDKLKAIYVQKTENYPAIWKPKLKNLDVEKLIEALNDSEKKSISKVFMGELINKLSEIGNLEMGIIYTQPLSEDGYITEEKKIEYYKKIFDYYSNYGEPIVKIHPRDTTYYNFNKNVLVLPASFPSEVLALLDIKFKYAIGICTSAITTTSAEYSVNLNEKFLSDLKFDLIELNRKT